MFRSHLKADEKQDPGRGASPSWLLFFAWLSLMAVGSVALARHEFNGAFPTAVAAAWPGGEALALDGDRDTLILFIHPRCPCTSATLVELDRVLGKYPDAFQVNLVVPLPFDAPPEWTRGRTLEAARRLPGARLVLDPGGELAARFGARDSGTVLVFQPDGMLRFAGGLTASRGHEGASAGNLAVAAIAGGRTPERAETPVFGCPLVLPEGAAP